MACPRVSPCPHTPVASQQEAEVNLFKGRTARTVIRKEHALQIWCSKTTAQGRLGAIADMVEDFMTRICR